MTRKSWTLPDRQAVSREPRLDHVGATDHRAFGDALFADGLNRREHAVVLAVGVDHALGLLAGRLHQRLHDEAGAEDEARQPIVVGGEVLDRLARHAGIHRRTGYRRRDAQDQPRIEG